MLTADDDRGPNRGHQEKADRPLFRIPRQPVLEPVDTVGLVAVLEDVTVMAEAAFQHEPVIGEGKKVDAVLDGGRIFSQQLQEGLWQLVRLGVGDGVNFLHFTVKI